MGKKRDLEIYTTGQNPIDQFSLDHRIIHKETQKEWDAGEENQEVAPLALVRQKGQQDSTQEGNQDQPYGDKRPHTPAWGDFIIVYIFSSIPMMG